MTKKTIFLIGFMVLKFVLQWMVLGPEYELHRDEFLHLDQANHLAWGYLSVPPVTSWISTLIQMLGNSVFWIKFFPSLFGALTLMVVWKMIEKLNGNLFALTLGATGILFSVLLRLNTLYQPNSLDVLCWTTFYFVVIQYLNTRNSKWFFLGAIVFALGFLNKYNMVFLVAGLVPGILLTSQKILFKRSALYLAVLMGLLLISPNLIWQYQHGFPVIHHLTTLRETQLVKIAPWDFLRSQLLFFLGCLPVIIMGLYALWCYDPYKKYRLFLWTFPFTLVIFLLLKAKDYYAIGLYPAYIAFGAVYLEKKWVDGWTKYLKPVVLILPILVFFPLFQFIFPNKSPQNIVANREGYKKLGLLRWEDGKDHTIPQDFADMLGWKELAQKVDQAYISMSDPERTLVLCDNYGQAGAINYYSKAGVRAHSFNADYLHWFELEKSYIHLIRIKHHSEVENELAETGPFFQVSAIYDSITNQFAREYGTTIFIFTKANIDINERIKNEINEYSF